MCSMRFTPRATISACFFTGRGRPRTSASRVRREAGSRPADCGCRGSRSRGSTSRSRGRAPAAPGCAAARASWALRRSSTSTQLPMKPAKAPASSVKGTPRSKIQRYSPSWRRRRYSISNACAPVEVVEVELDAALEVVGVHAFGPAVAHLLLERAPGEREPGLVEVVALRVEAGAPDHDRRVLDQQAVFRWSQRSTHGRALCHKWLPGHPATGKDIKSE